MVGEEKKVYDIGLLLQYVRAVIQQVGRVIWVFAVRILGVVLLTEQVSICVLHLHCLYS
jgi:hypothetical protein